MLILVSACRGEKLCAGGFSYPDLKLDSFVLPEDGLNLEVDADGGNESRGEGVVGVPGHGQTYGQFKLSEEKDFGLFDKDGNTLSA